MTNLVWNVICLGCQETCTILTGGEQPYVIKIEVLSKVLSFNIIMENQGRQGKTFFFNVRLIENFCNKGKYFLRYGKPESLRFTATL